VETPEAHTVDTDGLLLYSELRIGDSVVMIADTKPGWPFIGACCRYTVPDVERTLATLVGVSAR
jgi:PhnB protein